MFVRLFQAGLLAAAFAIPLTAANAQEKKENSATIPKEKDAGRHKNFLKDIAAKGTIDVVFLGDSITDGWRGAAKVWKEHFEPLHPINLGIGGDRTQHVLWRLQNGELDGYKPKAFVIMIGTNNMSSNSEEEIAAGVKAIIAEIHMKHADAKLLVLGVFPRSAKPTDTIRDKVKKTNELIAKFDDGKKVKYLDIGEKFLEPDGNLSKEIMPDYLHLSQKGYTIWAEAIQKPLEEMVK